jgi:hypothetical protein
MLAALVASLLLGMVATASAQESTVDTQVRQPVVVLVDLSGSLSQADLEEEVRAVLLLNSFPNIDLYVIGFASEGTEPAWEVFCEPSDDLDECTADIKRRTEAQGNDTDHAAALASAALVLDPTNAVDQTVPGLVLIMTDGRYDPNGDGVTDTDLDRLEEARTRLQVAGAEVWPLGFGDARQEDLDRLALKGPLSCDEPQGLIALDGDEVYETLAQVLANATCSPAAGPQLEVPGRHGVTLWYTESELPGGTVTIATEPGEATDISCEFDDLPQVWTCNTTTEEIDPGIWSLTPVPSLPPLVYPLPSESPTTTTVVTATTTPPDTTPPTTIVAQPADDETNGFPWWVLLVAAGLAGIAAIVYALTLPKLPRGSVAVRKGNGDWSPEETVRSERRQEFEIDIDGQYPSIMRTSSGTPDVVLEARRNGVFVSGPMVSSRSLIRLGDELELDEDIVFTYVTGFDDDSDEYDDGYDDDSDDYGDSLI